MFYKNAIMYKLTEPIALSAEELSGALEAFKFTPCKSLEPMRYGFVPPIKGGSDFVHAANGCIAICAQQEDKILPASAINEALEKKVAAIFESESRKVHRKERQELKDELIFSMLPQAFTKNSRTYAYIDTRDDIIYVDASSPKKAEDLISALREAFGSLPCLPIGSVNSPATAMTNWVRNDCAPENFLIGDDGELHANKSDRIIRCKKQDMQEEVITTHIDSGMSVRKLAVSWKEGISFTLTDDLYLKKLVFDDKLIESANDRRAETWAEQFDADFIIMTGELRNLKNELLAACGGIREYELLDEPPAGKAQAADGTEDYSDSLYDDAKSHVRETGIATISSLQRCLRVGYNRAARLMDLLENDNIVSKPDHSGGREVIA